LRQCLNKKISEKNKYLINRANPYLEIPVRYIYEEHGVKGKTFDKNIINKALNKCSSISLINNEYVKLKHSVNRNKLIIKSIEKNDEDDFRKLVEGLVPTKEEIKSFQYDSKFNIVYIGLNDEESAKKLLHLLSEKKFKEKNIDCTFHEENLFISMMQDIQSQRPKQPYFTPNYPTYNPMFGQNPFYMNPMMNPYLGYQQNTGYTGRYNNYGGPDKRSFKGPPGPGGDMGGPGAKPFTKYRPPVPDQIQQQPLGGVQPIGGESPIGQQQPLGQQQFGQYPKKPYVKKPYGGKPKTPNYNPNFTPNYNQSYNPNYNNPNFNPNFNPNYNQNKNGRFNRYQKGGFPKEEVVNDDKNFPPLPPDS